MKSKPGEDGRSRKKPRVRLLSVLLENRRLGWAMLIGGLVYFGLSSLGIRVATCPVRELSDWRCPGCGLTTSTKLLLQGRWDGAFNAHWFAPVFMLFWVSVAVGLVLPEPRRGQFLNWVRTSERVTQWPLVLGILLLIYALTRNIISN